MRYSPTLYAKSLFEVLEGAVASEYDSILQNFRKTVEKHGDFSRMNSIIESFERLLVVSRGGSIVEIETAREMDSDSQAKLSRLFKSEDLIKRSINPELVAGVRVEIDGEKELDYSLAGKFRKVFTVKI